MDKLDSLIERTGKLDIGESIFIVIKNDRSLRETIINLNQINQLLLNGIDADGEKIYTYNHADGEVYAFKTLMNKVKTGRPDDKVTFFQTGKFYKTFKVLADKESFTITANFDLYGRNEISRWVNTDHILGLTDESLTIFLKELIEKLNEYIKKILNV